jgi:PAS domain S-box-containing protein
MEYKDKDKIIATLRAELNAARKNEERLHTLVQASPLCIHEINLKGQITSMNKAGLTMMEMQSETEICGIYYIDFVSSEQKLAIEERLNNAFQGEYSAFEFSPENSELIFTSCFAPVFGESGAVERVMGITEDVTLQKKNEEELLRTRKLKSIGILAGGIAHDFNNTFTGIFGNLQLAASKLSRQHPAVAHIDTANQAMDKATRLSNQLLTFAKGGEPILETVDLEEVIEESLLLSLSGSSINTKLDVQAGLWKVNADKGQISQVIDNILINAKQAMNNSGELTIEVSNFVRSSKSSPDESTVNMVKIIIADNGCGIPKNIQETIFDPYFTTKQTGSGLGLATAYSIIKKHQGYIDVESEVGKGTNFIFLLNAKNNIAPPLMPCSTKKERKIIRSAQILIMDDEVLILDVLKEMLSSMGHTVNTATTGPDAIKMYSDAIQLETPFDVVILDLTIPGGQGGKEVIEELLCIKHDVKAVVMSGYSNGKVMSNPEKYGFHGRLMKPFTMDQIENLLSHLI